MSAGHGREVAVQAQATPAARHRGHRPGAGLLGLDARLIAPRPLAVSGQGGHDAVELAAGPARPTPRPGGPRRRGAPGRRLPRPRPSSGTHRPGYRRRTRVVFTYTPAICNGCETTSADVLPPCTFPAASALFRTKGPGHSVARPVEDPENGLQVSKPGQSRRSAEGPRLSGGRRTRGATSSPTQSQIDLAN